MDSRAMELGNPGPSHRGMEPPPVAMYSSLEELISQSNAHATSQGYKLVVVRSKTNAHGQKTWVHLACDRHGVKRNTHNLTEETRKKNRRSRRCECPMYCVAIKTQSNMWEMSVRHRDHNHGPVEPPVKKKKDLPPPPPSELVNLSILQTPSHAIADFCLIPIGSGSPSVSAEIAEVQRLLRRSGLSFSMSSNGTTVEGTWDDVMRIIGKAHALLHGNGVLRIQTDIRIGTRTDKKQSASDKVDTVRQLLERDAQEVETEGDTTMGVDNSELGHPTPHSMTPHNMQQHINPNIAPNLDRMVPPGMGHAIHQINHHPMTAHMNTSTSHLQHNIHNNIHMGPP